MRFVKVGAFTLCLILMLTGCSDKIVQTETSVEITTSMDPEESSAAERLDQMDSVYDEINAVLDSDRYRDADDAEKAAAVIEVLEKIAEEGTAKYPFPLVRERSWAYYERDRELNFYFYDGIKGGVTFYDPLDPYNPETTDVTRPK